MKTIRISIALMSLAIAIIPNLRAQDPLPSWNEGPAKQSITSFVASVTKDGSPDFVPPGEGTWKPPGIVKLK